MQKRVSAGPRVAWCLALAALLVLTGVGLAQPSRAVTVPASPPARICGTSSILDGPSVAPAGAVTVPAGDDSAVNFRVAGATYWFAPGVHTLGTGEFAQIIPGIGSTFTGAPGAILDGQHLNRYAFTGQATGVTIEHLTVQNFGGTGGMNLNEGVVNHDAGHNWTIENSTLTGNAGAGAFVGSGDVLRDNCLKGNGQYGFSSYAPAVPGAAAVTNVVIDHNEIAGNDTDNWEVRQPNCGCSGGGKFWDTSGVRVTGNYVHDNLNVGVWADTDDSDMLIQGNWFEANAGEAILYEISYNAEITGNVFKANAIAKGRDFRARGDYFPIGAIYVSESGGDSRVPSGTAGTSTFDISNNLFQDNWGGVILWENADRFCNSPANTSSTYCTRVNPAVTTSTCVAGTIDTPPYLSDCRWKTQNVAVHDNQFDMNPASAALGNCDPAVCGRNALLSNYGSYPSWSPYQADAVEQAITYHQNNHFSNNRYTGTWTFTVFDAGTTVSMGAWVAAPYNQDAGSLLNGAAPPAPPPPPPPPPPPGGAPSFTKTFESGTEGIGAWYSATVATGTAQAHAGTHSLAVTVGDQWWGIEDAWPGTAAATAGKAYTVSVWARAAATPDTLTLGVYWVDASGNAVQSASVATGATRSGTWTQLSGTVTAPAGAARASVYLTSASGTSGAVQYLDDLAYAPAS